MIRLDVVQGTSEWAAARLGIPTASAFAKIITPKKATLSDQAEGYMWQLLAEQILGEPMDNATSGFMERGTVLEKKAVSFYELKRDCDVDRVGFILRDDRRVGCSPDGFVGTDGLIEIKVPSAPVHVGFMLGEAVADKYRCQIQGQLWLCEREWIDTISYNPHMPTIIARQTRDDDFIKKLAVAVDQFLFALDEAKLRLIAAGHFKAEQLGTIQGLKVA